MLVLAEVSGHDHLPFLVSCIPSVCDSVAPGGNMWGSVRSMLPPSDNSLYDCCIKGTDHYCFLGAV